MDPLAIRALAGRMAGGHTAATGGFLFQSARWKGAGTMRPNQWNIADIPVIEETPQATCDKSSQISIRSTIVRGVNSFPTTSPPETVVLGNGWLRRGEIGTLISSAGAGKTVAVTQAAMAWAMGLSYFGIKPPKPLRTLLFSGEDDPVVIGQCRDGFIEHSEAITGQQLAAADLEQLDHMLRTEFSREHVGSNFHTHLESLLEESPADIVIINPLLSYIGKEIVANISEWMRGGIMPILQRHDSAALFAHHTGKMAKDGWDNTDDVYSAIGGAEIANIPRTILTLRPTSCGRLMVVKVSKRQTTGWKDDEGNFTTSYFVKRSRDPVRPAWIPVAQSEALTLVSASRSARGTGTSGRKTEPQNVVVALQGGPIHGAEVPSNGYASPNITSKG
ncbi:MAG: hypothetical protein EOP85_18005 [Verrucomicrobiaceae bacterium]|nr:MAG: hypothetical protein EOP85_18005 [Verrucomicrobiaceae bacterium]